MTYSIITLHSYFSTNESTSLKLRCRELFIRVNVATWRRQRAVHSSIPLYTSHTLPRSRVLRLTLQDTHNKIHTRNYLRSSISSKFTSKIHNINVWSFTRICLRQTVYTHLWFHVQFLTLYNYFYYLEVLCLIRLRNLTFSYKKTIPSKFILTIPILYSTHQLHLKL